MFPVALAVGSGGAISYVIQKPSEQKSSPSQPQTTIAPMTNHCNRPTLKCILAAKRDEQETLNYLKAEILARLNTP